MSKREKIKAEEKMRIVRACTSGKMSLNAAAEQLGVHQSVVDDWVRQYESKGIISPQVMHHLANDQGRDE